ncbi:MAG TPA: hypothetical protein VN840_05215 [Streptosporangiaceae bacterium]|nr:hypothetical protein [Streptosporangiaceae bacterium]
MLVELRSERPDGTQTWLGAFAAAHPCPVTSGPVAVSRRLLAQHPLFRATVPGLLTRPQVGIGLLRVVR